MKFHVWKISLVKLVLDYRNSEVVTAYGNHGFHETRNTKVLRRKKVLFDIGNMLESAIADNPGRLLAYGWGGYKGR